MIQARLSSARCPGKMIRPFAGSTLMDICIKKILNLGVSPKTIWVSVYEKELIDLCSKYPVNIFKRSKRSSESEGESLKTIFEWWDKIPFDHVVLVNACSPLLSKETIYKFYYEYLVSDTDGAFSVIEKRDYFWDENNRFLIQNNTQKSMNTKATPIIKQAAHCLYGARLDLIGKEIWMGDIFNTTQENKNPVKLITVPEEECFDIDYEWQFELYEKIYEQKNKKSTK